jgi:hypothetical protein
MLSALIISIESISRGEVFYFGAVRQSARIHMGEEGRTSYLGGIAGVPSRNNYVRPIDEACEFYSEAPYISAI